MKCLTILLLTAIVVSVRGVWREGFYRDEMIMGISFLDDQTGYVTRMRGGSGSDPNVGPGIRKTVDGGRNWEPLKTPPIPEIMMLMDVCMTTTTTGVAGGVGLMILPGRLYTEDGEQFVQSPVSGMDAVQVVKQFGDDPQSFAAVGAFSFEYEGLALTSDGGKSWTHISWPDTISAASDAEFVSATRWFVIGGRWPRRDDDEVDVMSALKRGQVSLRDGFQVRFDDNKNAHLHTPVMNSKDNDFHTIIRLTEDGGETFKDLFEEHGGYAFQSISCVSNSTCFVGGGNQFGGRVMKTSDSGANWDILQDFDGKTVSYVKFFDENNGWALGGDRANNRGHAARTTDGGQTWETFSTATYPLHAEMKSMTFGWASGPDLWRGGFTLMQFSE